MTRFSHSCGRYVALLFALLLMGGVAADAQTGAGNVYGTVTDQQGNPLPGVSVTLSGIGAAKVAVTGADGQYRFLGLDPGAYSLEAVLDGYSSVTQERVMVNINRNTTINVQMSEGIEETITVTAESPLLDERQIATGATVSKIELEKIPSARDPWVIIGTTPGVQLDRVNVGGNESGQQSGFVGPGDDGTNSTFSIDGVEITDIGAVGSSPTYYDFDAYAEMQVATGGSDVTKRTGGAGLNLVTKRGTNEFRGSGRFLTMDESWQADTGFSDSDLGPGQGPVGTGNRIISNEDYGAELGGPIVRDRLWFWLSYGESEIHNEVVALQEGATALTDKTTLESENAKINWQIVPENSLTLFYFSNDKIKIGRNAGPTRPQPTTWNQGGLAMEGDFFPFDERPTVMKLEDSHIFTSNFFLTGMYSEVDGGFFLTPQGSLAFEDTWMNFDQPKAALDESFIWQNSFLHYQSARPQNQYKADASYFFNTGDLSHELKFGTSYREGSVDSFTRWPGGGFDFNFYIPNYGYEFNVVALTRDGRTVYEVDFTNGYIQDTISAGNATWNVGLRFDEQGGDFASVTAEANPGAPELLPEVTFQGRDLGYDWSDISPRLGLTYDLGGNGKTLLRASYAHFVEQLGGQAIFGNPLYPYATAFFYYDDLNGDGHSSPNEIGDLWRFNSAYNPFDPGIAFTSDFVDPDLQAPNTDELVLGVDHALLPEFVIGANLTYRIEQDILEGERLVFEGDAFSEANLLLPGRRHTTADYELKEVRTVTLPDGSTFDVPIHGLVDGISTRGGEFIENSDREREYMGISLTANKRLANRWMLRGNFTWTDWTWDVPDGENEDPNQAFTGSDSDGSTVLVGSGTGSGAKGNVFISSQWSYDINALYQVMPDRAWGFDVSAHLYGREGYAIPFNLRVTPGTTGFNSTVNLAAASEPDTFRNDDIHVLDFGLQKEFRFDRVGLTLIADVFNVFNNGSVLQRQIRIGDQAGWVHEIVSPQIYRLGARINFN